MTPEKQSHVRKYNSNIITTEDNKIHIHLGAPFKRPLDCCSSPVLTLRPLALSSDSKETQTGTVLRYPHQPSTSAAKTTPSKMTSSITITPISSAASRPTQSAHGLDEQPARTTATQIPLSKGMKADSKPVLGISMVTRLESQAESQSMKIELRKATVCSSAFIAGGQTRFHGNASV
ncbi:hypothetical protein LDENG_00054510 [Lucifuga dentata]|nr:hypothetical protein LDENG_00054510 [Lucifuga dentata]